MRNVRGKLSSAASGERVEHSGRVPRRGEKRERTPQGAVADDRHTSVPILPAHRKSAPAGDNDSIIMIIILSDLYYITLGIYVLSWKAELQVQV